MTISRYDELVEMLFHNASMLLMSLVVCTFVCCKHHRKPKDPKFIDENDPLAKTLYNIKTDIAFPKRVMEEKQQSPRTDAIAMSWSYEYESNMPPSLSLSSSPTFINSKKYLKLKSSGDTQERNSANPQNPIPQQLPLRLQQNPNAAISIRV
ncbi:hypothetical protein LOAG_03893 [Loa loa]|uniref:Uncharacterized protein n=1 Tax=Loa loa TaxID=7209 RepID=A0A1I7W019_LOALO|nr:hypothetical protein LOAG_03893 [Loa loa]EFO24595.1 hypothetical protein LOAG_03893 [Loa loa]